MPKRENRPYIKYGQFVITADSKQWIVGVEHEGEDGTSVGNRTYHHDLVTALQRLADRKVRNTAIETLEELRDEYDRVGRELLQKLESRR